MPAPRRRPASRRPAGALPPEALSAFEIHHRVKNNLQVIASILRLQMRRESEGPARDALLQAIQRIVGMAAVHDLLAHAGGRRVRLKELIQRLLDTTLESFALPGQSIRRETSGEEIDLGVDLAIPLAVAANELIINAMKHAFRDRNEGAIHADLWRDRETLVFTLTDDGPGLPPAFLLYDQRHLGLRIVRGIVQEDLKGQFAIESVAGTTATIRVPLGAEEGRQKERES